MPNKRHGKRVTKTFSLLIQVSECPLSLGLIIKF